MKSMFLAWLAVGAIAASAQTLLVLNKEGSLAFVDPGSGRVSGLVRTGDGPHEVEASEDGKLAFVSNYGSAAAPGSTLSVIDVAARKERNRVDLGPLRQPHGLAVFGGKAWFTAEANKVAGRYDPASNSVDWVLGTGQNGTHMIQLGSAGRQIYTANITSNTISIFDQTGTANWDQTVVPVGQGPEGFDVTADGKRLWAANSRDGTVSIVDLAARKVVQTFGVQTKRSNRLKFSPDGRLVLISDLDAGELLILEFATKKELKRLKLGRNPAGILITPDSTRAFVAVTGDDNVAVIDLKTLDLQSRIKTGSGPDGMAWIP
jgi:DNA-binding beta-propeller fold protein YncE